jgi:hypothetical protein
MYFQPHAIRDAAHLIRNDATAKKGGELLILRSKPNVDGGVPGDRVRRKLGRERSLTPDIEGKA